MRELRQHTLRDELDAHVRCRQAVERRRYAHSQRRGARQLARRVGEATQPYSAPERRTRCFQATSAATALAPSLIRRRGAARPARRVRAL